MSVYAVHNIANGTDFKIKKYASLHSAFQYCNLNVIYLNLSNALKRIMLDFAPLCNGESLV